MKLFALKSREVGLTYNQVFRNFSKIKNFWLLIASIICQLASHGTLIAQVRQDNWQNNMTALIESAGSFDRGGLDSNLIALTFDGGWKCEACESVLNTLKEKRVKTTFFLTGIFMERYPQTVKRIQEEGHDVGNHTYSHPRLASGGKTRSGVTRAYVQEQLNRAHALYFKITGAKMNPYWRAPYGQHNAQIRRWAAELGYVHVGWTRTAYGNMDTLDWISNPASRLYRSSDEIARKVVNFGKGHKEGASGAIVLMHLGSYRKKDFPHERLGWIIDMMRAKGYEFVTITDMLRFTS